VIKELKIDKLLILRYKYNRQWKKLSGKRKRES